MELRGKVVLVTGASSGIGAATARRVCAEGAHVVLAARRADRLAALAAELRDALSVPTDMRRPQEISAMVDSACEVFGGVDVLVNNAGQGLHVPVLEIALDDLVAVTELNLYAPLLAMQAVVPVMRERGGGSIVNVSSGTVLMPAVGTGGYTATKAALDVLSRTARAELADEDIVVSTVYPFVTATEFHRSLRAGAGPGSRPGLEPHPPELVAEAIVGLIRSGEQEAILVPGRMRAVGRRPS